MVNFILKVSVAVADNSQIYATFVVLLVWLQGQVAQQYDTFKRYS